MEGKIKCGSCVYRCHYSGSLGCGYFLITNTLRGEPVAECSKYKKGRSILKQSLTVPFSRERRQREENKHDKN